MSARFTYTTKQIATALKVTDRAVRNMAAVDAWPRAGTKPGRGGGKLFEMAALPQDVQSAIVAHEISVRPEFLPQQDIFPERVQSLLDRWQSAQAWNQDLAQQRLAVLQEAEAFVKANPGMGRVQALDRFCAAYNSEKPSGPKASRQTLYRWDQAYRRDGLAGLLSERGGNRGLRLAMTPEVRMFVLGHLQAKPHLSSSKLHRMALKRFGSGVPSYPTIYRFVKGWKDDNHELFAMLEDPRRWKNSYLAAHGDRAADVPHYCHTWEMDSTPADVMTADGKRCSVIGCIDIFSRRMVLIVAPTSKAVAIAACIRKAILAWGVPVRIRMDNGKDYKSVHITAVLSALEIERVDTRAYHGEDKPFIERALGTMTHDLHEMLVGYTGHSVAERGALREQKTWASKIMRPGGPVDVPLTMDELAEISDRWSRQYDVTPHRGINLRTPTSMAEGSRRQPARIRDERVLDILLAPVATRVVGKKGIELDGAFYKAPELVDHMRDTVEVRRDLEDAGIVHVFRKGDGKFICKASDAALEGVTLGNYLAARRRHNRNIRALARAGRVLSEGMDDPTTLLLPTGELETSAPSGDKIVGLQPEADTPAIREARKAERVPASPKGLADELAPEPKLPANVSRLPEREPEPVQRPVFQTAIEAYDWVCELEQSQGRLSVEDAEWKAMLATYPEVQSLLRLRERSEAVATWENF